MLGGVIDRVADLEVNRRLEDIEQGPTLGVTAVIERLQVAVVDRLVVDQMIDGFLRRHRREPFNLFGRPAEARPLEQMSSAIVTPIGDTDG